MELSKRFCALLILALSSFCYAYSQKYENFQLLVPAKKVPNSLYKTISFIDSRLDTMRMGNIKRARVKNAIPFIIQLQEVLDSITISATANGELLFQLRQMSFAVSPSLNDEKGYCYIRANLYSKLVNGYKKLANIDTIVFVKDLYVKKPLLKKVSNTITDFIITNLTEDATNKEVYSYSTIIAIDSFEKRKISVYDTAVYTNGVYRTFQSFCNQLPDLTNVTPEWTVEQMIKVKGTDANGKQHTLRPKQVYAIVLDGKIYIATPYDFQLAEKRNDNFYFNGILKKPGNVSVSIAAAFFFGVLGGVIFSLPQDVDFEMMIDHINGDFIPIKPVKTNKKYTYDYY